jgi:hypothetical protein
MATPSHAAFAALVSLTGTAPPPAIKFVFPFMAYTGASPSRALNAGKIYQKYALSVALDSKHRKRVYLIREVDTTATQFRIKYLNKRSRPMTETIMLTKVFPEAIAELIPTEKVRIQKVDNIIQLVPMKEKTDCTRRLRGMFAGCPELSVDRYLEEKRAEKELEL